MSRFIKDILDVKNVLGRAKNNDIITLHTSAANPFLFHVTCTGDITIETTVAGGTRVETFSDLTNTRIDLTADANTDIIIRGKVTYLRPHDFSTENHNYTQLVAQTESLIELTVYNCKDLLDIDVTQAPNLERMDASFIYDLAALDLSNNTKLQRVEIQYTKLQEIDIANSPDVSYFMLQSCHSLKTIYARALVSSVATNIASLITANAALRGTVYLFQQDTYYNTIKNAADNAGWTVAEL